MIIGVDESGRGPLAGPVVAAAVILCDGDIPGLNDSKQLSEKRRVALEAEIKARCQWAIGVVDVEEIDRINILQATMQAMIRAVDGLLNRLASGHAELGSASMGPLSPRATPLEASNGPWTLTHVQGDDFVVLVDGNRLPPWQYRARAIIGGDASEPAISAASIIAKQARDAMMLAADARYPGYGFARHKGYGTAQHLSALRQLGPCPIHRTSFAPVRQMTLI